MYVLTRVYCIRSPSVRTNESILYIICINWLLTPIYIYTGDVSLALSVKLLIIDEVHLLHDDRGPVLESLVARTIRQVETSQKMIRLVGLSATLPNYLDVARFLQVNPHTGLFFFDSRFRPVPLCQTFIGVKGHNKMLQIKEMDLVCYDKALSVLKEGHQVVVLRTGVGKF